MQQSGKVGRDCRLCDVCERVDEPTDRSNCYICKECAHPERVRVFHQCCGIRLDFSLQEAQRLFSQGGMNIWRTGVTLRFKECPNCAKDQMTPPDVFTIDVPDSELQFSSFVAQA